MEPFVPTWFEGVRISHFSKNKNMMRSRTFLNTVLNRFRYRPKFAQRQHTVRTAGGGEGAERHAPLQLRSGRSSHVVGEMVQGKSRVLQVLSGDDAHDADISISRTQRRRKCDSRAKFISAIRRCFSNISSTRLKT